MVKEMLKEKAGYLLSNLLSQGGEYGEIFYEKVRTCRIQLEDNKIDKVQWGIDEGVGLWPIAYEGGRPYGIGDLSIFYHIALHDLKDKVSSHRIYLTTTHLQNKHPLLCIRYYVLRIVLAGGYKGVGHPYYWHMGIALPSAVSGGFFAFPHCR